MQKKTQTPTALALIAFASFGAGCASVPAYKQQHVSKPGMAFSDSLVQNAQSSLTAQIEPGAESAGGAQASGCSACR